MAKLTTATKGVLRRAFHEAYVNVDGLIDAYGNNASEPAVIEAKDFLAKMDAVSRHLLGEPVQTLADRFDTGRRYRVLADGSLKEITREDGK